MVKKQLVQQIQEAFAQREISLSQKVARELAGIEGISNILEPKRWNGAGVPPPCAEIFEQRNWTMTRAPQKAEMADYLSQRLNIDISQPVTLPGSVYTALHEYIGSHP